MNRHPIREFGRAVRNRCHPLYHARRSSLGRVVIRMVDRPVWLSVPGFGFRVRGRLLTHGLGYSLVGSQEVNPEALVRACVRQFSIRSFWDVGSNFGYYSWLVKSLQPGVEMVLIEPLPANARLIRATLDRNRFSGDLLLVAAASDHAGEGVLRADVLSGATSTMENRKKTFEEHHAGVAAHNLTVPMVSIDEIRRNRTAIDLMKIDVEGHEAAVLRGARETIVRDQPVILIECGHPGRECLNVLISSGYCVIDADHLGLDRAEDAQNFLCLPPRYSDSANFLLQDARSHLS